MAKKGVFSISKFIKSQGVCLKSMLIWKTVCVCLCVIHILWLLSSELTLYHFCFQNFGLLAALSFPSSLYLIFGLDFQQEDYSLFFLSTNSVCQKIIDRKEK